MKYTFWDTHLRSINRQALIDGSQGIRFRAERLAARRAGPGDLLVGLDLLVLKFLRAVVPRADLDPSVIIRHGEQARSLRRHRTCRRRRSHRHRRGESLSQFAVHLDARVVLADALTCKWLLEAQLTSYLTTVLEEDELDGEGDQEDEDHDVVSAHRQPVHQVALEIGRRLSFVAIRQQNAWRHRRHRLVYRLLRVDIPPSAGNYN